MNIPEYNNHDSGELCSGKGDTTMMKLQLTHFSNKARIEWRRKTYTGSEISNFKEGDSRWATLKPAGVYLGFGDEYMDWRYGFPLDLNAFHPQVIESVQNRVQQDMIRSQSWNFKHTLTVNIKRSDLYIVNSNKDLPIPTYEDLGPDLQDLQDRMREEYNEIHGETWSKEIQEQFHAEFMSVVMNVWPEEIEMWDEIQSKYKAIYITNNYFKKNRDVLQLHMRQLILFDTNLIEETVTYGKLFDFMQFVSDRYQHIIPTRGDRNFLYAMMYNKMSKELVSNDDLDMYLDALDDDIDFDMLHVNDSVIHAIADKKQSIWSDMRKLGHTVVESSNGL